jgi:hypothetical protein
LACSKRSYAEGGILTRCSQYFEVERYDSCVRTVSLPSVGSGSSLLKELAATNKALRSDMRILLNQLCRSGSPAPERCDDVIPPVAP